MGKTKCHICGTEESKYWTMCLGGWTLCGNCSKDYQDFTMQVKSGDNIVIMMEVYFKRGKGEKITYEQLHKEKSSFKFLTFNDLYNDPKVKSNSSKK